MNNDINVRVNAGDNVNMVMTTHDIVVETTHALSLRGNSNSACGDDRINTDDNTNPCENANVLMTAHDIVVETTHALSLRGKT